MDLIEDYAKKRGWRTVEGTKHWYAISSVAGHVWVKLGARVKNNPTVALDELRNSGGHWIAYYVTGKRPPTAVKVISIKSSFTEVSRCAKSWMKQHD